MAFHGLIPKTDVILPNKCKVKSGEEVLQRPTHPWVAPHTRGQQVQEEGDIHSASRPGAGSV